jgi:hypothetical protein
MELQFPTLFYRCPGIHFGTRTTYDYFPVENEDVAQMAFDNDCFPTLQEAESAFLDKAEPVKTTPIIVKETKKGKKQSDPVPADPVLPPSDPEQNQTENDVSQSEQQPDPTHESTSDSEIKDQ